jgi:hypothetical protein
MLFQVMQLFLLASFASNCCFAFTPSSTRGRTFSPPTALRSDPSDYEKKNAAVSVLSNFMQEEDQDASDPFGSIDFNATKFQKVPIETLAAVLDYELTDKEWFVTGNVNPIYFSDNFEFQDPDVKLSGIENYARGVYKLFDQGTSRAEIISTFANEDLDNTITVTWRLSGKVNIGPGGGLTIKPYICSTNFKVNEESGLIDLQEDEFDIPQWDILLSSLFPFLIGKVTSPPAPPVERQDIPVMPNIGKTLGNNGNNASLMDSIMGMFK